MRPIKRGVAQIGQDMLFMSLQASQIIVAGDHT